MLRLVSLGVVAALFFSSTFVLNRAMSLAGGHWAWSSSLRFFYLTVFLALILTASAGFKALRQVWVVFRAHLLFWMLAGGIGFGVFYSLITFASAYAPGWIVATTWQTTILATPLVLMAFGKKVPRRGLFFTLVIFSGIVLVNLEHLTRTTPLTMLAGALPVLVSALAYPTGNQLIWEAVQGTPSRCNWLPSISDPILQNPFARVLLLTLGSIPFWLVLLAITRPPAPSAGQLASTALVALLSGVVATSLFLSARHLSQKPYEIAAVDSTQSMEVVFSLAGEVLFLGGSLPGALGWAGIALTVLGLVAYILAQNPAKPAPKQP
jgi:drug/metabolite transporter (DMT)-like permease